MHGISAAIGPTAQYREFARPNASRVQHVSAPQVAIARHSPMGQPEPEWRATSRSGSLSVYLDGEIFARGLAAGSAGAHIAAFAEAVEAHGIDGALETLDGGSFVAIIIDAAGRAIVVRDPLGTLPVYEAHAGDDWLVATSPVALARCAGVDTTPDRIGLASLVLVGYTIGTRYLVRGIRTLTAGAGYVREPDGAVTALPLRSDPFSRVPDPDDPTSTAAIAASIESACRRLADTGIPTAHMQSGGMDSRLVLAAWPPAPPITCYGYGDPHSGEVRVAREVAAVRGAPYCHAQPSGSEVASALDDMFEANGLMVYPARWFLAERIAADGHRRVLDGFAGDFLLGGLFYAPKPTMRGNIEKMAAWYRDATVDTPGLETLATDLYTKICQVPNPDNLAGYIDAEFVHELKKARSEIEADIRDELARLRPAGNSAALLVRNFMIANRSAHAIAQQGVMSRHALSVGLPFAADYEFLKLVLAVPLSRLAYRRLQLAVFRAHFPAYAEACYAGSMLPLRRSAAAHQTSSALLSRGIRIPGLTGQRTRAPNNWARWLHESADLRERAAVALQAAGIGSPGLSARLVELAQGTIRGSGKLLHLASVGRWLSAP